MYIVNRVDYNNRGNEIIGIYKERREAFEAIMNHAFKNPVTRTYAFTSEEVDNTSIVSFGYDIVYYVTYHEHI